MAAYQPPKSILVHGAGSFESYLKKRSFFFFNDPAPTEIYTLSLHDALPTSPKTGSIDPRMATASATLWPGRMWPARSEEHTSELQSHVKLVCRLRLEKKNWRFIAAPKAPSHPHAACAWPAIDPDHPHPPARFHRFFLPHHHPPRDQHSFPTRRSSD